MENYTISDFQSHMPMRCMMQRLTHDRMKMHDYFEVTMVVKGKCMLTIGDDLYHLETGDVFCVNPHRLHELRSADCVVVTIHFDQMVFVQTLPSPFYPQFFCVSSVQKNQAAFDRIRTLIAQIVQNNANRLSGYELRNWSLIYLLMDVFYNNFRLERSSARESRNYKYSQRMAEITRIVRENYMENLSLQDISDQVHLSVPYLSKFFTEQFGMNFLAYVNQYRLNHAVHELVNTDKNIDEIALESGFSSSHAFVNVFRKEFDMLPNAYRRQAKAAPKNEDLVEEQHAYIASLAQYLHQGIDTAKAITPARTRELSIELPGAGGSDTSSTALPEDTSTYDTTDEVPAASIGAAPSGNKAVSAQSTVISAGTKLARDAAVNSPNPKDPAVPERTRTHSAARAPRHVYPLRHTWKNMITIGTAHDLLLSPVQDMVRKTQEEIGFTYIRMNGILSDSMMVCSANAQGKLQYSFTYVDLVLDFLRSVHLKPWLQLSFMPRLLALHPDKRVFNDIVSQPKNNKEWCALVRAFMEHIRARYGAKETESWWYSVWNQPNTASDLYGFDQPEEFQFFFRDTFRCIRDVSPRYRIAIPPTYYLVSIENSKAAEEKYINPYLAFLAWCRENDCFPDALSFTYYDMKLLHTGSQTPEVFGFPVTMRLSENPDSFRDFVMQVSLEKRNAGIKDMPVYLTEWNNTPSQQDLLNDTCFKSCYIVKNILENYDRLESFAFWSLTDLMRDAALPEEPFFGGGGLFTRNGVPKPSYYAFCFLNRLGKYLVARGDGYFMTEGDDGFQLLLYNYEHYSNLYANGEKFDMTRTNRYTVFARKDPVTVELELKGLPEGDYTISELYVNQNAGSVCDAWIAMGAPDQISPDMTAALTRTCPGCHQSTVHCDGTGTLSLSIPLALLEIRLVTITPAGGNAVPQ